jgi:hypothetical protein
MKANFKINDDKKPENKETPVEEEKKDVTDEEFIKKGMNVWTFRSKSKLVSKQ